MSGRFYVEILPSSTVGVAAAPAAPRDDTVLRRGPRKQKVVVILPMVCFQVIVLVGMPNREIFFVEVGGRCCWCVVGAKKKDAAGRTRIMRESHTKTWSLIRKRGLSYENAVGLARERADFTARRTNGLLSLA